MEPSAAPQPTDAELRDELRSRLFAPFAPRATRILGVPMHPFTLAHWRTLDHLQSPFAPDTLDLGFDAGDLIAAAHVLSLPGGDPRAVQLGWWKRKLWWWRAGRARGYITAHGLSLDQHIATCMRGPAQFTPKNSTPVHCPAWLYLTARLIEAGWSEAEAWAKTPGEARMWLGALSVAQGGLDFVSEEHIRTALEAGYTLEEALDV